MPPPCRIPAAAAPYKPSPPPMAGKHCASVNLPPPQLANATTMSVKSPKPPHSSSIFTPLSPRKLTKRKNYLRPKILKTLTKSLPGEPTTPVIPTPENDSVYAYEPPVNEIKGIVPVDDGAKEIQVSETESVVAAGEYRGFFAKSSATSVLKIGLGFVAVFLLQAICTVWILGEEDAETKNKNRNKNVNGFYKGDSVNGGNKGDILMNKNSFVIDKTVEDKINEIRARAREARESEEMRMRNGDDEGGGDGIVSSKGRIDIEKEIGARLVKVENKFNSRNGKSPGFSRDVLDEFEDDEEEKEADKTLMFKKKQKFRGSSVSRRSDVKGFSGMGGHEANEKRKSGLAGANGDLRESISGANSNFLQNNTKSMEKMPKEIGVGDDDTRFGTDQETSQEGSIEAVKPTNSRNLKMQNSQNFTKESLETTMKSKKHNMLDRNGGLKHRTLEDKPSANITRANKSAIKSDLWWSNLPYVLAIVMRRGLEQEGAGLFALRIASEVADHNEASYTVAFENHVDANNFCHLLESYFEDLGDFSTDIIPLPVKDLLAPVKSKTKKVIVVKKGQLKLYAGQPFADVEKALLSFVEKNDSASTTNVT